MANRHANKGLRRAILARMARTGERYQRARTAVLRERSAKIQLPLAPAVDVVETVVYGRPVVLVMFERRGVGGSFVVQRDLGAGQDPNYGIPWRRWRRPFSA